MVVARIRDSAKARSSGTAGFRWWQTISMSRCSATVLTVCGRVGLVEPGSTFGSPAMVRMSGACPPPAPSTWNARDAAVLERGDRAGHEPGLVERVGVQRDLQPPALGPGQRGVDGGRRGSPVLVHLVAAGTGQRLLLERGRGDRVALAQQQQVDRERVQRAVELLEVPGARGDRGGLGALRRAGAAAAEGGQTGRQRLGDLRRRQEVHVGVEAAGGEDLALAGDHVGARPDHQGRVDAVGDVGVAAAADADDPPVADADVGPDDPPVVEDRSRW